MEFHDLLSGFMRIHILRHAAEGKMYGQWLKREEVPVKNLRT